MTGDDIATRFDELTDPESDSELVATKPLPGTTLRLAKVYGGEPALVLIHSSPRPAFGTRLRHVAYEPAVRYSLSGQASTVAVFMCRNSDRALRRYFFRVISGLVDDLPGSPTFDAFDQTLRGTMALFDALAAPGASSIQGVWAEVLLILISKDPNRLVSAWHDSPRDKYDFAAPPHRLEVKSTVGQVRVHRFALEQLDVAYGGETVVASLCLRQDDAGRTVADLIDELAPRLDPQHQRKLDRVIAQDLGNSWRDATELAFDQDEAIESLRYYLARAIPSVRADEGVSAVKFDVNLAETVPASPASLPSCPLFAALPGLPTSAASV